MVLFTVVLMSKLDLYIYLGWFTDVEDEEDDDEDEEVDDEDDEEDEDDDEVDEEDDEDVDAGAGLGVL